jgi:predicted PurR-regulated permease PerM
VFSITSLLPACLFAAWMLVVLLTDNLLTPILMGRGSSIPTLVLFMGSIGGFISYGFLGLFLGAVIFSIGYKAFDAWLNNKTPAPIASE